MFPISEARSVTQNSYGLINISVYGAHNESTVNFDARALDPKVVEALMQSFEKSQENQRKALQPILEPLAKLGVDADRFKQAYKSHLERSGEVDVLSMYVPVQGIKKGQQGEETVELEAELERFFASEATVFLLQGVAGTGKSTFNRHLALKKLEDYQRLSQTQNDPPLVFFIELRSIDNPNKQVIEQFLQGQGFASEQIELLRIHLHQRCIFIFDGYDEIKERNRNFYDLNELGQWEKAKFVITSRPEYLDTNYQAYFRPKKAAPDALWEARMAPFSAQQRSNYIENYVNKSNPPWTVEQYEQAFNELTTLSKELERPVVLRMLLQILPELGEMNPNQKALTLGAIYEHYFQKWWGNWQTRLGVVALTPNEEEATQELSRREGGFIQEGFTYIENCAVELTKAGLTSAQDTPNFERRNRKVHEVFFKEGAKTRLLRFNAPFQMKQKQHYEFSHKSMQEYLVARAICAPDFEAIEPHSEDVLNQLSLVKEQVILDFLTERVKGQPQFKAHLHAWIEASKAPNAVVTVGAANAITILVRAGVQFNGTDLKGIRIAGADLSYGVFDHTQFEGADLSEVNLRGAWLRKANLNRANLSGMELGERPALKMKSLVYACCYSPDGRWFAVGDSRDIQLYETQALQSAYTYVGHESPVTSVAFSSNGQWLASGSMDKTVKLWHLSGTRVLEHTYIGHKNWINSLAFSPDGQWLASGSKDHKVKLWRISGAQALEHTYVGHRNDVESVAFSPDGQWLASGSMDNTVKLWAVSSTRKLRKLKHTYVGHEKWVTSVAFSGDGQWLASGSWDKTVKLWDISGARTLAHTYAGHGSEVLSVVFSPRDGQWLASGSSDNTVKLWSVSSERKLVQTYAGHNSGVRCVVFSHDDQWIASGSLDRTVKLWSVTDVQAFTNTDARHESEVRSVAFSPNGQWLASGSSDHTVKLWSLSSERGTVHTYVGHTFVVNSVAFSPNGEWVVSSSLDNTVKLWSVSGERTLACTYRHVGVIRCVAFSHDNQWVVSGGDDSTVKLWSVTGAQAPMHTYDGHRHGVSSVAFSPNGQWLASGSSDHTVKLWSISNERKLAHTYAGHKNRVNSVAFSPDSQWLASGCDSCMVKLWAVSGTRKLRQLKHTYTGHERQVQSVAFSPDGQWLASGSEDCTVKLWSVRTRDCQATLQDFVGTIYTVAWRPSSNNGSAVLATGGEDKSIRLWRVYGELGQVSQIRLEWTSDQTALTATGAVIETARNLSPLNTALLKQRGAAQARVSESAIVFSEEGSDKEFSDKEFSERGDSARYSLKRSISSSDFTEIKGRKPRQLPGDLP